MIDTTQFGFMDTVFKAAAPLFGQALCRSAADLIYPVPHRKPENNLCEQSILLLHKITAQAFLAAFAGRFAVQRITHGIKNSGFASAGRTGDDKNILCAQPGKIQLHTLRVRPKGLHDQL